MKQQPGGEQPLPDYGCCCLGSINLARFIREPFQGGDASVDYDGLKKVVPTMVRMLDRVLDTTYWPLEQQRQEAMNKRRIGLGITGLGDALAMLGVRYDSDDGRALAGSIQRYITVEAYKASVEMAREYGAFPLFSQEYLKSPFIQRLPKEVREGIAEHGIRNSHLISIAPTGTISLAFGDNVSNGIEPAFAWHYNRKVRQDGGSWVDNRVEDYAFRLYREMFGEPERLPASFVSALEISAEDHKAMVEAVAPWVDSSISKTVNVPEDYPYEDFKDLYVSAYRAGLKGITTFRPNAVTGSVLSTSDSGSAETSPEDLDQSNPDRRVQLDRVPEPALASLRWPSRPETPAGNPSQTYLVDDGEAGVKFAAVVGHIKNGRNHPFEVWTLGNEQPRVLSAVAKLLSMDMRSSDNAWLAYKLDALERVNGQPMRLAMPPEGERVPVRSPVAALARLVRYRCEELDAMATDDPTPVMDALMSLKEPKAGPDGTMSWTVDVMNPATGDDFIVVLKELTMPDGQRRPYSVWVSGEYPAALDGLCKVLSLDMRVIDLAWVGEKLRQLRDYPEHQGDFLARIPGKEKQRSYPSTVAYMAELILHRFVMLGLLDEDARPVAPMGVVESVSESDGEGDQAEVRQGQGGGIVAGKQCSHCGHYAVIPRDGCDYCTACGAIGHCG
ncbi:hypothetical protein [Thiohalospira halophila]|uniref:hypothetical protein n=1 Tax=Thiohalospira halophila TaxID=381300 RepID=UPI000B85D1AC|nr:hypothetical protein [Thiohalospira halophila]